MPADSVMVAFRVGEDMHRVFEVGKQAEALINAKLKAPMELELENVYLPFMLFAKKVHPLLCGGRLTKQRFNSLLGYCICRPTVPSSGRNRSTLMALSTKG